MAASSLYYFTLNLVYRQKYIPNYIQKLHRGREHEYIVERKEREKLRKSERRGIGSIM